MLVSEFHLKTMAAIRRMCRIEKELFDEVGGSLDSVKWLITAPITQLNTTPTTNNYTLKSIVRVIPDITHDKW